VKKKTTEPTGKTAEIRVRTDDGGVSALTQFLPDTAFGFVISDFDRMSVGVGLSGGGDTLTSRALYRFDISGWAEGTITFHGHCISKTGSLGNIQVYVIDEFGTLHNSPEPSPEDVSGTWNLLNTGIKVGEISPSDGDWFEVSIPNSVIQEKRLMIVIWRLRSSSLMKKLRRIMYMNFQLMNTQRAAMKISNILPGMSE